MSKITLLCCARAGPACAGVHLSIPDCKKLHIPRTHKLPSEHFVWSNEPCQHHIESCFEKSVKVTQLFGDQGIEVPAAALQNPPAGVPQIPKRVTPQFTEAVLRG